MRWRKCIGEEGAEKTLLTVSIDAARRDLQGPCAKQVIVDAAVMHQSCRHLIKKAREHGLRLRQNYSRAVP